jgi:hypothetical protein
MFSGVSRSLTVARQDKMSSQAAEVCSTEQHRDDAQYQGRCHTIRTLLANGAEAGRMILSRENNSEKLIIDFTMDEC